FRSVHSIAFCIERRCFTCLLALRSSYHRLNATYACYFVAKMKVPAPLPFTVTSLNPAVSNAFLTMSASLPWLHTFISTLAPGDMTLAAAYVPRLQSTSIKRSLEDIIYLTEPGSKSRSISSIDPLTWLGIAPDGPPELGFIGFRLVMFGVSNPPPTFTLPFTGL